MSDGLKFKSSMRFAYGEPTEMRAGVLRLVANNPGPMTFKGTNTYLVMGPKSVAVIDPGPKDAAHGQAIAAAAKGRSITHIFVTHAHRDHVDGAAALRAATGAPVHAFPRAPSDAARWQANPTGKAFIDTAFQPDRPLADGDTIEGGGWTLRAVHTPGHAPDHLCFALDAQKTVFSGDHVMAWNTTVIAPPEGRMADYFRSLEILLARDDDLYLPGHGGRLAEPRRTVKAYLLHRRMREQAILDAVRGGAASLRAIVPAIYGKLEGHIAMAAALSAQAHVEHLVNNGKLICDGPASGGVLSVP